MWLFSTLRGVATAGLTADPIPAFRVAFSVPCSLGDGRTMPSGVREELKDGPPWPHRDAILGAHWRHCRILGGLPTRAVGSRGRQDNKADVDTPKLNQRSGMAPYTATGAGALARRVALSNKRSHGFDSTRGALLCCSRGFVDLGPSQADLVLPFALTPLWRLFAPLFLGQPPTPAAARGHG